MVCLLIVYSLLQLQADQNAERMRLQAFAKQQQRVAGITAASGGPTPGPAPSCNVEETSQDKEADHRKQWQEPVKPPIFAQQNDATGTFVDGWCM